MRKILSPWTVLATVLVTQILLVLFMAMGPYTTEDTSDLEFRLAHRAHVLAELRYYEQLRRQTEFDEDTRRANSMGY